MTPPRRLTALVAGAVLLMTACTGGVAAQESPLAFTAVTVEGTTVDGASLSGTPTVLWFWAPWCTLCRAESPGVRAVAAEFDGRVEVIGVAGRGPVDDMAAFVSETGTGGLTHLADVEGAVWSRFGILAQPSFAFVSADGSMEVFSGSMGEDDLRDAFNELIGS